MTQSLERLPYLSPVAVSLLAQVDIFSLYNTRHDGTRHQVVDNDGYRPTHPYQLTHPSRLCYLPLPTCQSCDRWQDFEDRVDTFPLYLSYHHHSIPILQCTLTQEDSSRILSVHV